MLSDQSRTKSLQSRIYTMQNYHDVISIFALTMSNQITLIRVNKKNLKDDPIVYTKEQTLFDIFFIGNLTKILKSLI